MTDQADIEARATAIAARFGFWGPGAVNAMLSYAAEREAAAYARAAEVARGEKVDADATDDQSDRAYNRACDHISSEILALGEAKG